MPLSCQRDVAKETSFEHFSMSNCLTEMPKLLYPLVSGMDWTGRKCVIFPFDEETRLSFQLCQTAQANDSDSEEKQIQRLKNASRPINY